MKKALFFKALPFILLFILISYITYLDSLREKVCIEESKVVKILSLNYRDADILLENGMVITVNQASLEVGDDWCVSSKIIRK